MKKSLVLAALLAACSASAFAAEVTLYGIIDLGLQFTADDYDDGEGRQKSFTMASGQRSGSRFGLRGTENLGEGYLVGFNLEAGFNADSGTSRTSGSIFDRESLLYVVTPYGEIGMGKTGQAMGSIGRYTLLGWGSAFGTSWSGAGDVSNYVYGASSSNDMNNLTYRTPSFGGFQAQAHYSFGRDATGTEGKTTAHRQYSAALTYQGGPAAAFLAVESTNWAHASGTKHQDDSITVTLGGNYDFGVLKLFATAQYFDNMALNSDYWEQPDKSQYYDGEGYGIAVSASIPLGGGNFLVGAAYTDGEANPNDIAAYYSYDYTRWGVHAGYTYAFSRRTDVYAVAGYIRDEFDFEGVSKVKPDYYTVMVGMRHMF